MDNPGQMRASSRPSRGSGKDRASTSSGRNRSRSQASKPDPNSPPHATTPSKPRPQSQSRTGNGDDSFDIDHLDTSGAADILAVTPSPPRPARKKKSHRQLTTTSTRPSTSSAAVTKSSSRSKMSTTTSAPTKTQKPKQKPKRPLVKPQHKPPPLSELSIRTRSFSSSRGNVTTANGDDSVHAVGSVVSGRSMRSGRSATSGRSSRAAAAAAAASNNPFDDRFDEYAEAGGGSVHAVTVDDGEGDGEGSEDSSDGGEGSVVDIDASSCASSSAASQAVSELSVRSARSLALEAVRRKAAEEQEAAVVDEDGRWEEGSDGEWRQIPVTKDDNGGKANAKSNSEEQEKELWEEGSDGEWRRVVVKKDQKEDKASSTKEESAKEESKEENEEGGVWEEDSDGEWKLVPKKKEDKEEKHEDGVWEEDSDGEWKLVPKKKSSDTGKGTSAPETEEVAATTKVKREKQKRKLNPFDSSSSSSSEAADSAGKSPPPPPPPPRRGVNPKGKQNRVKKNSAKSGPISLDGSDSEDDGVPEAERGTMSSMKQSGEPVHPLLADPTAPRLTLDQLAPSAPADSSPSGPSLLARAKAKREAEDQAKAKIAEQRAREREMAIHGGIPSAIGGSCSFDQDTSVMTQSVRSMKSHEVSTTANSTTQRSVRSYGEQSDASSANAVAVLPSMVNVSHLAELDGVTLASASSSTGEVPNASNALSARDAIMAAASRHRSRFGTSRLPSSHGASFDSEDPVESAASASSAAAPLPASSVTGGRPPLLDRRSSSMSKKFMTPLERQRELRRSQRMATPTLNKLNEIKGDDVNVAVRADEISIAPSLGVNSTATAQNSGNRDFNRRLLRGFASTDVSSSPVSSPDRSAGSSSLSPKRSSRVKKAKSRVKSVFSAMALVDDIKNKGRVKSRDSSKRQEEAVEEAKGDIDTAQNVASVDVEKEAVAAAPQDVGTEAKTESSLYIANDVEDTSDVEENSSDGGASLTFGMREKPVLPLRSHPEYSKYFAMLKASVPPTFVRKVCEIDGKDPSILGLHPETPYKPKRDSRNALPTLAIQEEDGGESDEACDGDATVKSRKVVGPSPRGVADIRQVGGVIQSSISTAKSPQEVMSTSSDASNAALKTHQDSKVKLGKLFASRAAASDDSSSKLPKPGKLSDSGRGDVAALFASRAAASDDSSPKKPKPGKLSDSGKGDVAALFASKAAASDDSSSKLPKPGKLSDSGRGDVASLFAARAKQVQNTTSSHTMELSTPVAAAAEKIEQKEEENKAAARPPLNKDPDYAKYFKMIAMGIPTGAVQQALARDGKDPSILHMDPSKPYNKVPEKSESQVPLREDPDFAKYFKMLKMGLPLGAVKQAMVRDGMDPAIIDMNHDKPLSGQTKKGKDSGEVTKTKTSAPKVLRKKLFWTSIDKSKLDKDSLWTAAAQESQNLEGLEYDMEEFASLFTKQNAKKGKGNKASAMGAQTRKSKAIVQLIDGRREMNGSILLRKFKHDYEKLANDIDRLDVGDMDENEVRAHMQLLPTKEEAKKIEAYLAKSEKDGSKRDDAIAKLGECEKFMTAMMGVDDIAKKFECMLYRSQFEARISEMEEQVNDLLEGCKCVRNSDKLRRLMVFALRLGNTLNTGESGEAVSAITLDSLLKMHEAKSFDKQTSVLHYLVSIIEKNDREVLSVKDDLEPAKKAERIVMEGLKKSLRDLSSGLDTINDVAMELAQRQADAEGEKMILADVNDVLGQTSIGLFALKADDRLKKLSLELDEAFNACSGLLKYFGEDVKMPTDVFFCTLNGFVAMFGKALEDNQRKEKARVRREKLAEKQKKDGGMVKKMSFGSNTSGSERSLADSRSKILQELSTGVALSKLKRVSPTTVGEGNKISSAKEKEDADEKFSESSRAVAGKNDEEYTKDEAEKEIDDVINNDDCNDNGEEQEQEEGKDEFQGAIGVQQEHPAKHTQSEITSGDDDDSLDEEQCVIA